MKIEIYIALIAEYVWLVLQLSICGEGLDSAES